MAPLSQRWMAQRGSTENSCIQCLLGRLLIRPSCKVLSTKAGMAWLKGVQLPLTERLVLDSELRQLEAVEKELTSLDEQLIAIAGDEPRVRLLMTLPGVSHVVVLGLSRAIA